MDVHTCHVVATGNFLPWTIAFWAIFGLLREIMLRSCSLLLFLECSDATGLVTLGFRLCAGLFGMPYNITLDARTLVTSLADNIAIFCCVAVLARTTAFMTTALELRTFKNLLEKVSVISTDLVRLPNQPHVLIAYLANSAGAAKAATSSKPSLASQLGHDN